MRNASGWGEGVGQVAEVHQVDNFLGGHGRQQLPQRDTRTLGLQVPQRVDGRTDRHVHDTLLRAQPAQLGVVHELAPEAAEVDQQRVDVPTEEMALERSDRRDLHLVAPADGEDEAVPLESVICVGADQQIAGGVVRVGVHGIGTIQGQRRGEADVVGLHGDDGGQGTFLHFDVDERKPKHKHRMSGASTMRCQ